MKLNQKIISRILNDLDFRRSLAYEIRTGELGVKQSAQRNKENGSLTRYSAILALKKLTGLSEKQILVNEKQPA